MSVPPTLLIDLGNTNLKWALYRALALGPSRRVEYRIRDLSRVFDEQWGRQSAPARVLIASVAEAAAQAQVGGWVREHWRQELIEVRACKEACGVVNAYADPAKLGVDRWLTLIAVHRQIKANGFF